MVYLDKNISALVEEYGDELYGYVYHMVRDREDAQDIIQEVFIKILKVKSLENIKNIKCYLYKLTYNFTVDFLRRKNRFKFIKMTFEGEAVSAEQEYLKRNVNPHIQKALNTLNYEERTIFLLRTLEEMDYASMSEILDLKEATVRKKHERARKKLKVFLERKKESEVHEYEGHRIF